MALEQAKRQIRIKTPLGLYKLQVYSIDFTEALGRLFECRTDLLTRASYELRTDNYRSALPDEDTETYHRDFACIDSKVSFRNDRTETVDNNETITIHNNN